MNKKFLSAVLLLSLLAILCSTSCLATDDTLGNTMDNSMDKAGTTLQSAGEGIRNAASDIGNGISNAASSVGRGIEDIFNGDENNNQDNSNQNSMTTNTEMAGTNYNVARTSTDRITGTTMSNSAWVWLILGIVGVAIVGLTWYYVSQNNDTSRRNH